MLLAATVALGASTIASAQTVKFQATMTAAEEIPATNSKGSGTATAELDQQTHKLSYNVTWQGFASRVIAAHFHGPAEPKQNAGVQVPIDGSNPTSPVTGTATLTPEQQQQLMAGLWYVNVHTQNHPNGAIRGQVARFHP
jgi:CHRD domain-containing protein